MGGHTIIDNITPFLAETTRMPQSGLKIFQIIRTSSSHCFIRSLTEERTRILVA
jgi:hypothetical protein